MKKLFFYSIIIVLLFASPSEIVWAADASATAAQTSSQNAIHQNEFIPGTANLNITYTPLEPFVGIPQNGQANFCDLITVAMRILIALGGMFAVAALVFGGITYMVSEVVDKKSQARERIERAFWGLLVLLSTWIILNTVNPQLLSCNILNPATNSIVLIQNNTPPSGCIGANCVDQGTLNAVNDVQTNGVVSATTADVQITAQTALDQQASCETAKGIVTSGVAPSMTATAPGSDKTPCQIAGYSTCTALVGGSRMWCAQK